MTLLERFCYWFLCAYLVNGIVAYHFDSNNITLYNDTAGSVGSYFGYTVALRSHKKSTIIVGAPKADYKNSKSKIVKKTSGNIFNCDIDTKQCGTWKLKRKNVAATGAWMGASLAIENSADFRGLVCAPNWISSYKNTSEMRGLCYFVSHYSKKLLKAVTLVGGSSPAVKNVSDEKRVPYARYEQLGFSIATTRNQDQKYILGCPGLYNWRGTPMFLHPSNPPIVFRPHVNETGSLTRDSLSGYAVTSGSYFSPENDDYATGAPRANGLRGKVIVFNHTTIHDQFSIDPVVDISGEQIGEYFGAALASCDINGDKKDELLVGAPHWTLSSDEGRIYIYTFNHGKLKKLQHINGTTIKGRFGSTITCLGDVDKDGFQDVAVGAPYDGNGAVYIYHGGKGGILTSTQNIPAPSGTRGFGISISKAVDTDGNGYADFAVGAHLSGHVSLIISKYVVRTIVTLNSNLPGNQLSRNNKSFTINVCCSKYEGPRAPPELNVTRVLEIDDIYQRAYFNMTGAKLLTHVFTDTLKVNEPESCRPFEIYLRDSDEISDFKVSVTQHMNTHTETGALPMSAVMNEENQTHHLDIKFAAECGNDVGCNSDLSIHMTNLSTVSHYVIGSQLDLVLNVIVGNTGDPAYYTKAIISMPSYIKLSNGPPTCEDSSSKTDNWTVVKCFIAKRLVEGTPNNVTLRLDMSSVPWDTKKILLEAKATTQSNDNLNGDHATRLIINCVAGADIGIAGETNTDLHRFNLENRGEQSPSIRFIHTYEIRSYYESTPIVEATIKVSIPTDWIYGGHKVRVLDVKKIITDLGGTEFDCVDREDNSVLSNENAYTTTKWLIGNKNLSTPDAQSKFQVIDGKVFGASADNITFFINTTNPEFEWKTIDCKLGPLNSTQKTARLGLEFDLLLRNFIPEMMGDRGTIFFVTNASTSITQQLGIVQAINNTPDSILIGTRFLRTKLAYSKPPSAWILPASVGVGLFLLALIIIGLVKYGFFKRDKKAMLEKVKEEGESTPKNNCWILETTSSTEILNTI